MNDTYSQFSLATFESLDIDGTGKSTMEDLKQKLELDLMERMNTHPGWEGVEQFISDLNANGHHFEMKKTDENWLSFFEETNKNTRDFWIHANREDEMIFVNILYFEKMEVTREKKLAEMDDEDRLEAELENRFYDKGLDLINSYDNYPTLPLKDRLHLALYLLETGVNNGGFETYIANTEGSHLEDVAGFLATIGAKDLALIVTEVLELFPSGFSSGLSDEIWKLLEKQRDKVDELDTRFYNTKDNLAKLVMNYLENS